jgi:hypothetical protein
MMLIVDDSIGQTLRQIRRRCRLDGEIWAVKMLKLRLIAYYSYHTPEVLVCDLQPLNLAPSR